MADIAQRMGNLNPFSKKARRRADSEDFGEQIDSGTVAGGGHTSRHWVLDLRVSHALRSFMVDRRILSEKDAVLEEESALSRGLLDLVSKPHIHVPPELTDRSHPLPEYFISSSHNTYLMAHQLFGDSCATAYDTALRTGARCVEIDAWDNSDNKDEPKVTHGYTMVSNIPFRTVCETIRDALDREVAEAATTGTFRAAPVLLSLENHCDAYGQKRLVDIMTEVWGHRLLSKAARRHGHQEQAGEGDHVTLEELGSKIAVIVEYHIQGEPESDSSSSESSDSEDEEEKKARKEYKDKKKASCGIIIPELTELGVYAQSVKPSNDSWYTAQLISGPHHHLINVSELGVGSLLPQHTEAISKHNAHHLMRVFPKGTRISSGNLKPVAYWGIGAQICALNLQNFGTSNQLNEALFSGTDGYVLKPAALRAGGSGKLNKGRKKKLILHVAGATDIPLHEDSEADGIKPYLTCTLYHPDDLKNEPPKRKTSPYKQHKLGFLHRGENPPPTDPIWDETLEWEYEDNELVFVRMLIKSDDSWAKNPMFANAAVRLHYVVPGWSFIRMLDMRGHETKCSILVRFEITDA
ncbi:PLC-like phosphodiesterase [Dactylonectria macrodidyma]|uniref:Phosphoinositide phospholipase C n=1 Tax=Dactylonectria macrodidyma TaxID=307937 RepID=A0A9P9E7P0_9HYPO|nr:PLC-like phosphodiesterase [Dactylonectria macrodidyma]